MIRSEPSISSILPSTLTVHRVAKDNEAGLAGLQGVEKLVLGQDHEQMVQTGMQITDDDGSS